MSKHGMARHDGGPTESTATRRAVAAGDAHDAQRARPLPACLPSRQVAARACAIACLSPGLHRADPSNAYFYIISTDTYA